MVLAVQHLLAGTGLSPTVTQMASAVADFQVSDNAYQLFAREMPNVGIAMPPSQWVTNTAAYGATALVTFAHRLVVGAVKAPEQALAIDSVTTDPPALSAQGGVQVLSPASTLSVTAVIDDVGQTAEGGVRVTATITPAEGAPDQQVSAEVNLSSGQSYAVALPGLVLAPSVPTSLTITATGPASTGQVTKTLRVEIPGPGFTGVTTTTAPRAATTTSVPAAP
jgi:hypothetical protein